MPDVIKLQESKEKIISIIKVGGPSYPAKIAQAIGIQPLFISAFLSELVREQKLKLSNMKIGSSPLYYTDGQESFLTNFIQYLNSKEREAFLKLKGSNILEDEKQEPAIRVALRRLKDFAFPINVKVNGETKLFWRYFLLNEAETKGKINEILRLPKQIINKEKIQPIRKEGKTSPENIEKIQEIQKPLHKTQETLNVLPTSTPKPKEKKTIDSDFTKTIKEYLQARDIEILEEITSKKKEFQSKIRIDTLFGKQSFYLTAKEKKKISTNDLVIAHQNAQSEKMPALLISSGELDKKALEHMQKWKQLIKFEKINL